jgi:flagellin-specific chaperone FliS
MNAHKAYQQNRATVQPRIDTTIGLYEAIIARLEKALAALARKDAQTAKKQVAAASLGVAALASAFDARAGELAVNLLRLYGFVAQCLKAGTETEIKAALDVLRTLQEGFVEIRPEAVQLERAGKIPPLLDSCTFQTKV